MDWKRPTNDDDDPVGWRGESTVQATSAAAAAAAEEDDDEMGRKTQSDGLSVQLYSTRRAEHILFISAHLHSPSTLQIKYVKVLCAWIISLLLGVYYYWRIAKYLGKECLNF